MTESFVAGSSQDESGLVHFARGGSPILSLSAATEWPAVFVPDSSAFFVTGTRGQLRQSSQWLLGHKYSYTPTYPLILLPPFTNYFC